MNVAIYNGKGAIRNSAIQLIKRTRFARIVSFL
jgi:hypothetical protein